jgi:hypothetical protein
MVPKLWFANAFRWFVGKDFYSTRSSLTLGRTTVVAVVVVVVVVIIIIIIIITLVTQINSGLL